MIYLIVGMIVLAPVVWLALLSATAKKPSNLGVADGPLAPCPNSPNCVSTQASDDQHRIESIAFNGDRAEAVNRLKAAIGTIPRMRIVTDADHYIHADSLSCFVETLVIGRRPGA
jgi:uncharacterized protein (DUF1499 family)